MDAFVNERALRRVGGVEGNVVIQVAPGTKVYLACRPVSMRYGFDGLAAQVARVLMPIRSAGTCSCSAASAPIT